jgi:hypothetical protein
MCGFAFAEEELGYVYFKCEVIDTPWKGYVPPRAANLNQMVCLDITFKSNLPKEYTDYFIDFFENSENNEGITVNGRAFSYNGKVISLFTRTEDGFVSRRPFAKKWDHPNGAFDSPNGGSYENYREAVMQGWFVNSVQIILDTAGYTAGGNFSAKAVGNTAVPGLITELEQGFSFREINRFERRWVIYKE